MAGTSTRARKLLRIFSVNRRMSPDLRKAITGDSVQDFHQAWLADLAKPLKRIRKALKEQSLLSLWSENGIELSGRERELAASLDEIFSGSQGRIRPKKEKKRRRESVFEEILTNWLVESSAVPGPWETLVIAEILLRESHQLTAETFVAALSALTDSLMKESIGGLFEGSEADTGQDDAIRQMISSGESQWICSLLLKPLHPGESLRKSATESLEKVLNEGTDADGMVHGSMLGRMPEWLAPLSRCTFWSAMFEEPLWSADSRNRLNAVVERAAMLVLPLHEPHGDGETPQPAGPSLAAVLKFLVPLTDSRWQQRILKLLKQCERPASENVPRPKKFRGKKAEEADSNEPSKGAPLEAGSQAGKKLVASWESDTSCVAILRSGLDADSDVATLEWHSSGVQIMLAAAGVPVLAGHWDWSVRVDGQPVQGPSTWKCSCWFLDPETVFVELEGEDSAEVRRVRQLLLAPHERFAVMTDSVRLREGFDRRVELDSSVPLAFGSSSTADPVTRELSLITSLRTIRAFPVWMKDDRIQSCPGSFREQGGRLELSSAGIGGVTMPLALDWHPRRAGSPADWTRLTVTETRRIVGTDEATGHRIRIGDHQVLIYRSLVAPKNSRAVLGLHTWDETVYTRVPSKPGPLEPLVEVETPE